MDDNCHAHTILIIDDGDEICIALTRLLAMERYQEGNSKGKRWPFYFWIVISTDVR